MYLKKAEKLCDGNYNFKTIVSDNFFFNTMNA